MTYEIDIAGLKRDLPICKVTDDLYIGAFVMFGDVELTVHCATELLKRAPEYDYLIAPEAKAIPLLYEMARQSGAEKYFLARKTAKAYMSGVFEVNVKSITTAAVQRLIIDSADAEQIRGKRMLILDDVISTGESLRAMEELVNQAGGNIVVAIIGKFLIQTLVFMAVIAFYEFYIYHVLHFPRQGGVEMIVLLCLLQVISSIGFGIFAFGLMPSLRMSMSVCSLWAVLSLSMAGSAFPIMGMDEPLQSLSWLFPLRHYYMLYQITVFNGYPLIDSWFHLVALIGFTLLPWFVVGKIKNAMLNYVYIP